MTANKLQELDLVSPTCWKNLSGHIRFETVRIAGYVFANSKARHSISVCRTIEESQREPAIDQQSQALICWVASYVSPFFSLWSWLLHFPSSRFVVSLATLQTTKSVDEKRLIRLQDMATTTRTYDYNEPMFSAPRREWESWCVLSTRT
jgi:hypothetical protein